MVLLKYILYIILFYYCFLYISRFLVKYFIKKWVNKIQNDLNKKSKSSHFHKHSNGETEFSQDKEKPIDPGGDYVDFEEVKEKE